ncbi:MAG: ATP-binding protein [Desulfopila sp.]
MQKILVGKNFAALKIVSIYGIVSVLWILFSDQLLLWLVVDPQLMTRIQMMKGWIFVLVTSLVIYVLLRREISLAVEAEGALKGKEHDYQEVFNATKEGIAIHDVDSGAIIDLNLSFARMFDYSRDEIMKLNIGDLSQGSAPYTRENARRRGQLASRQGPQMFEWQYRRRNGEIFWGEVILKEAIIGGRRRLIAVVRDIEDRKAAEARNLELEQRYQQAQKMEAIGTLAGGIAHDFNNILTAVLGYADLAGLEVTQGSQVEKYLQEVNRAGNRAKELVKQILTFCCRNQPEAMPLRLQPVVEEAMKLLRASIPKTIDIAVRLDDGDALVFADPTQIHQVVMNLCTNAYHAMRESGGELTVALDRVELSGQEVHGVSASLPQGKYLRLMVVDTGVGMPPEIGNKIFEPYFTTKPRGEGTGMGLSMVHGIVASLGGEVTFRSVVGAGTTFEVYLPIRGVEVADEAVMAPAEVKGAGSILFVDDESALADLGRQMLTISGYEVVTETDSERALELFRRNPDRFDLIISDLTMPRLDGLSLMQQCRVVAPHIPVILQTGYSEVIDRERALAEGANEFLFKPLSWPSLVECVERVLRTSTAGAGEPQSPR